MGNMTRIALIGAGSVEFTRRLTNDILLCPSLQDCTIALMDIDTDRLALARDLVQKIITVRNLPAHVEATLDRRTALKDAMYVIVTIHPGGLEAYEHDITIPLKYGVGQCVGDTLGPGGVFRGLRTIPVLLDICRDMNEVCPPQASLINYSNPMAINCWGVAVGSGRPHIGPCHSVQSTAEDLAEFIGAPLQEISYWVAGINHQAWFLELRWNNKDAYPLLRERIRDPQIVGREPIRTDLMHYFGYFVTESSAHASEYIPYYRKTADMIENEIASRFVHPAYAGYDWGRAGGNLKNHKERLPAYLAEVKEQIAGRRPLPEKRSGEYVSYIMEAIETHRPALVYGNVPNTGLITNLPQGCCVEVPCLVDTNGIQPCYVGELPPQLAALNRTNINVQELAVRGALTGDREMVHYAVALDPLTAAVCTLPQIRQMVDELFEVEVQWLPQFA
jgi:alpha-galactosidase